MQKSLIIVLITAVVVAIFAVLNADPVPINLIFSTYHMSQAVVILVSTVLGALSMFVLNAFQAAKLKKQIKQLSKKLIDSDAKKSEIMMQLKEAEKALCDQKNANDIKSSEDITIIESADIESTGVKTQGSNNETI